MDFSNYIRSLLLWLSTFALLACGVDSSNDRPAPTTTEINDFFVVGTVDPILGIDQVVAVDNTGTNNHGVFEINWDVVSSNPYSVKAYFSANNTFTVDDLLIFHTTCGSNESQFSCDIQGELVCVFTDEDGLNVPVTNFVAPYYIRCGETVPEAENNADITALISGFPQSVYLIVNFCNGDETSCQRVVNELELRNEYP